MSREQVRAEYVKAQQGGKLVRGQEFDVNRIRLHCYLPKHLVHHIQEPDVRITTVVQPNAIELKSEPPVV